MAPALLRLLLIQFLHAERSSRVCVCVKCRIFYAKVHLVKTMVFPVVMYVCESLTIKKAEHQRIDAFELW